jgi:SAM-dependent methyltransferase
MIMDWRITGFFFSAAVLVLYLAALSRSVRDEAGHEAEAGSWWRLVIASFLTLFAELALIRWIGTEVRVFAYVKNLALLLCFLGFGVGCALARRPIRWWTSAIGMVVLLMVVRWPWKGQGVFESLSQALGAGQDILIWASGTARDWSHFLPSMVLVAIILLLIAASFIPLGQIVSRELELADRPLKGYSWNLAASLGGILGFFAVSWLMLPPSVWMAVVFVGGALLQTGMQRRVLFACLSIPAAFLLHDVSTPLHFSTLTPYKLIEYRQANFLDGEFKFGVVEVNHTGYQFMTDLSPAFLQRHPNLLHEPPEQNPYNVPFSFTPPAPRVLIVGAGTGNDVAAAVRHNSASVDAVEIDPVILGIGRDRHPEHPYSDSQVSAHVTDARAFMKRANRTYDLVLFGLLDSHTLADYSNMRIDNFVYTKESFQEARALLAPDGVLFVKFRVDRPWLGQRLQEMLTDVFGKKPVMVWAHSTYSMEAVCFAISRSDRVERMVSADSRLRDFIATNPPNFLDTPSVPVTTDDWPFLYQQGRWLPGIFISVGILVLLLGGSLYLQIPEARRQAPSLFFFSMGAGFLLLETQVVSRLALYFGTTWQVNGIVIASILVALLLANAVIENRKHPWPSHWNLVGLLGGLLVAYFAPFQKIPGSAALIGWIAAAVFTVPIFFAGLLFATEFRAAESPSAALGANMLGAVVGGLLENLSLVIGLRALLLVALVLYLLAGAALIARRKASTERALVNVPAR